MHALLDREPGARMGRGVLAHMTRQAGMGCIGGAQVKLHIGLTNCSKTVSLKLFYKTDRYAWRFSASMHTYAINHRAKCTSRDLKDKCYREDTTYLSDAQPPQAALPTRTVRDITVWCSRVRRPMFAHRQCRRLLLVGAPAIHAVVPLWRAQQLFHRDTSLPHM